MRVEKKCSLPFFVSYIMHLLYMAAHDEDLAGVPASLRGKNNI